MTCAALRPLIAAWGPTCGAWGVRLLAMTLSIRREEQAVTPLWQARTPVIYAVWHARILLLPLLYGARPLRALASRSRDGELVTQYLARFGVAVERGSSSRGGAAALHQLARWLRQGGEVVVVPDGPRGPAEVVKPGIVALARLGGAAIVPVALGASAVWRLGSWDRFCIPRPFARCVARFGEPIYAPPRGNRRSDDKTRDELEAALRALSASVDREARG